MPSPHSSAGSPQDWLRYAQSDLELAQLGHSPRILLETLCFHAQQAAEKSIKAVLMTQNIPIPRTHSIDVLLNLLPSHFSVPDVV